jgi:pimeloyl-ACP methyl ester carboxylesterase
MQTILIAGFWLDGDSWGGVAPALVAAGHTVHTPTLPGKRGSDTDLAGNGLGDHVDAVVALVDSLAAEGDPEPVVPVTVIACQFAADLVRQAIANEVEWAGELAAMQHLDIVELPTGHWPQFTKPAELAASIVIAVQR